MCFDSKVVDDPKRLSYQLTSSCVNAFLNKVGFCCIYIFIYAGLTIIVLISFCNYIIINA